MTGLIRLICELPIDPPSGAVGKPVVMDVQPDQVGATVAQLQAEGWQLISEWAL